MSDLGNKQIMAHNIQFYMKKNGVTATDICTTLKFPPATFSDWINAKTYPRIDKIELLANYFGISKADLVESREQRQAVVIPPGFQPIPPMVKLPLVGRIACGEPITAEENLEGAVNVPEEWGATFVLTCYGDSMEPKIKDGDLVAIRKQPEVENGQIAAVRIDNEATLKRVYRYPDRLLLQPENPAYEPIILVGEEMNGVAIEGRAVGLCRGI